MRPLLTQSTPGLRRAAPGIACDTGHARLGPSPLKTGAQLHRNRCLADFGTQGGRVRKQLSWDGALNVESGERQDTSFHLHTPCVPRNYI
jgi:hypothetical protein